MSKITFRADDELIQRLEAFDASKSEVMREALRAYLDEHGDHDDTQRPGKTPTDEPADGSIDDLIAERVDEIVADRLDGAFTPSQPQDINVNIALDGESTADTAVEAETSHTPAADASHTGADRKTPDGDGENAGDEERKTCSQCGEDIAPGHVYCPN